MQHVDDLDEALQPGIVGRAGCFLPQVLGGAGEGAGIELVELQHRQQHQRLGVEHPRAQADTHDAFQRIQRFGALADVERQHAQPLQARHALRRQAQGASVRFQCEAELPLLEAHAAEQVPCVGIVGALAQQLFQRGPCLFGQSGFELGARQAEARPGQRLGLQGGAVQARRASVVAEADEEFGGNPRGRQRVVGVGLETGLGDRRSAGQVTRLNGIEDGHEHLLAVACLEHSLRQRCGGVRLEQVAVERGFRCFGHHGVRRFASHHDEHGGVGQRLAVTQFVEQVLPGHGRLVEVVVAQHDVERGAFDETPHVFDAARLHHLAHAHVAQGAGLQAALGRGAAGNECPARSQVGLARLHGAGAVWRATAGRHSAGARKRARAGAVVQCMGLGGRQVVCVYRRRPPWP